jgi:hypothetical protein
MCYFVRRNGHAGSPPSSRSTSIKHDGVCTVDSSRILPATVNLQETPCPTSIPPTDMICPASSESGLIGSSANAQSCTERNVLSPAQENLPVFPYLCSPLNDIQYLDSHEVDSTLEEGFPSADSDKVEALGVSQEVPANYPVASVLVQPPETIVVMKSKDASATWKVVGPDYDPPLLSRSALKPYYVEPMVSYLVCAGESLNAMAVSTSWRCGFACILATLTTT